VSQQVNSLELARAKEESQPQLRLECLKSFSGYKVDIHKAARHAPISLLTARTYSTTPGGLFSSKTFASTSSFSTRFFFLGSSRPCTAWFTHGPCRRRTPTKSLHLVFLRHVSFITKASDLMDALGLKSLVFVPSRDLRMRGRLVHRPAGSGPCRQPRFDKGCHAEGPTAPQPVGRGIPFWVWRLGS